MTTTTKPRTKRFGGHLGKTPCGRPCCLRRDRAHVYCTCVDNQCRLCHAPSRFGRTTARVEPAQPREGVRE